VDLDELVHVARDDDADRRHAVVRGVGRVERAAAGVEPDLALDRRAELGREALAVDLVGLDGPAVEACVGWLADRGAQRVTSASCTPNRAASLCFSSSPLPGRERLGERTGA
jgi:hypothetical protein